MALRSKSKRVRVATIQYLMTRLRSVEEFEAQVASLVRTAADDYKCDLVVFPEYFTAQLLTIEANSGPIHAQIRRLAEHSPGLIRFFAGLARKHKIHIVAGTFPILAGEKVYNDSHLFDPQGKCVVQGKMHLSRFEQEEWRVSPRDQFKVFETTLGRISIAIGYDVEFPEVARRAAREGVQILIVPCCTDDERGFLRVRYCAHARAIENQLYVVVSHTVGSIPTVPTVSLNYGQAAILTPSDVMFARGGIVAEGLVNQEGIVIGELDLELIAQSRTSGSVLPLHDSKQTEEVMKRTEVQSLVPKKDRRAVEVLVRQTRPGDFAGVRAMGQLVYPHEALYTDEYLQAHLDVFPEGQFVAVDVDTQEVIGMASTLMVDWSDYNFDASWEEITGDGSLTTHNPKGRTLYAADVMVHPAYQGRGIGKQIYAVRRDLAIRLRMLRIRAGARLPGYQKHADRLPAEDYVFAVVKGELYDPTLSFQLKRGFHVLAVLPDYLHNDPESKNYAALIEWINHRVAKRRHYQARDPRFQRLVPTPPPEVLDRS